VKFQGHRSLGGNNSSGEHSPHSECAHFCRPAANEIKLRLNYCVAGIHATGLVATAVGATSGESHLPSLFIAEKPLLVCKQDV